MQNIPFLMQYKKINYVTLETKDANQDEINRKRIKYPDYLQQSNMDIKWL